MENVLVAQLEVGFEQNRMERISYAKHEQYSNTVFILIIASLS